jgi:hypothetical protein
MSTSPNNVPGKPHGMLVDPTELERVEWADSFSFASYGVRVAVRVNNASAAKRIRKNLPLGSKTNHSKVERVYSIVVRGSHSGRETLSEIYEDDTRIVGTPDRDALFKLLESNMRLFVAERARQRVFVHAGVVAWRDRAIIIPGRSYSGKSSMTAAFVRAGAIYYSDEYAVLDARGRVHPYLKPISIRENGTYDQTDYPIEALGGKAGTKPLPVQMILVSKFQPGARWRPEQLSAGKGVLELLDHTVSARYSPERALATLRQTVKGATVLKGKRGEADEVVASILQNLNSKQR